MRYSSRLATLLVFGCFLALVLIAPLFASFALAQGPTPKRPQPTSIPTPVSTIVPIIAPTPMSPEVIALRSQIDVMRDYDDRLLSVIYWSLGGILAAGLALLGANWFTTNRLYQQDKENLRQELRTYVQQQAVELRTLADGQQSLLKSDIDQALTDVRRQIAIERIQRNEDRIQEAISNPVLGEDTALAWRLDSLDIALSVGLEHYVGFQLREIQRLVDNGARVQYYSSAEAVELYKRLPQGLVAWGEALLSIGRMPSEPSTPVTPAEIEP